MVDVGSTYGRRNPSPLAVLVLDVHADVAAPHDDGVGAGGRPGEARRLWIVDEGDVAGPQEALEGLRLRRQRGLVRLVLCRAERSAVAGRPVQVVWMRLVNSKNAGSPSMTIHRALSPASTT